jgi:two-component system LytT family response regulator
MKAIIVDDELSGRNNLCRLIEEHCHEVKVVSICSSASEAYSAILEKNPDVVFLDIEMPRETGFDLLSRIPKIDFRVIFVTAYDKYAIQAIKLNALDYLLKPVRSEDLVTAVQKVQSSLKGNYDQLITSLLKSYGNGSKAEKLAIPVREGFSYVNIKDIIRCEADANYTRIVLFSNVKILSSKTLGEYEETLSDFDFIRVHKSHMINLSYVKNYVKGEGGVIKMSDGYEVPVSRRKREEFLAKISPTS